MYPDTVQTHDHTEQEFQGSQTMCLRRFGLNFCHYPAVKLAFGLDPILALLRLQHKEHKVGFFPHEQKRMF